MKSTLRQEIMSIINWDQTCLNPQHKGKKFGIKHKLIEAVTFINDFLPKWFQ